MNTESSDLAFIPYHCQRIVHHLIFYLLRNEHYSFSWVTWSGMRTAQIFLTRAFCDCDRVWSVTTYFLNTVFSRTLSKKWKECGVLARPVFIVFPKPLHHLYLALLSILLVDLCKIKSSYPSCSILATLLLMPIKSFRELQSTVKQLLYFQTEGF